MSAAEVIPPAGNWKLATALRDLAEVEGPWMTAAQLAAWRDRFFPLRARLPLTMWDAIGISRDTLKPRLEGRLPIRKVEALACAHYALGFDLPCPAGDVAAFNTWFRPRFGQALALNDWLELPTDGLASDLRGYQVRGGKRYDRAPDAGLIRALDWIWRVGPVVPWARPA